MLRNGLLCIWLAFCCVLLPGMLGAEEKRAAIPLGDSPSLGPADAPVTIIEFIDFQ